jgi:hypothetical protein
MENRRVIIRFVRPGERVKRATLTYVDYIPEDEWGRIHRWATSQSDEFGKARKVLTVNIVATTKEVKEER